MPGPRLGDQFAEDLTREWKANRPDIVHAHFWMSGLAALEAARPLGIPVVLTFHALGIVKRRHQGNKDTSPPARLQTHERLTRALLNTDADSAAEAMIRVDGVHTPVDGWFLK